MPRLLPQTKPRTSGEGSWVPALVLLTMVAVLVAWVPPSQAGERTARAESGPVGSSQGFSQASSYRVHLPLVLRDHWVYPDSAFGVQISYTNASLTAKMATMGAQWVRLRLSWSAIEPFDVDPEDYLWSASFDRELARLAEQGLAIILTLMDNPDWAATNRGGPVDKVDIGELVEFMEAAVARYGAPPYEVKYWEFYNEPDNGDPLFGERGYVGVFGYNPEAYVALLQAVYGPMKAVDPEAQITFGGIAYERFDDDPSPGPFVRTFLDEVLANGGGDYFDVMNFHFYPAFAWRWEAEVPGAVDILAKYKYLRDKLASHEVYRPFVCTETSKWSADIPPGGVEAQSRYVAQVFARSMAAGFRFTTWWTFYDVGTGTDTTGLLDADFEPKPAYWAYQTLARQLGGAAFVRTWNEAETGSPLVEAYEFEPGPGVTWSGGAARIVAAWTNDEAVHTLVVPVATLVEVDKYGSETQVYDGDDGEVDGLIHLALGPSPVYLRLHE